MRNELIRRLQHAIQNDPKPGRKLSEIGQFDQGQWVLAEFEAFMREHEPKLKMMARPEDIKYSTYRANAIAEWDAAPLTPWEGNK